MAPTDRGTALLFTGAGARRATLPITGRPIPDTRWTDATVFGSTGWEPPPRPAGDYVARFCASEVPTARAAMFTVRPDGRAVIRHLSLVNASASSRTLSLWLAGVLILPEFSLGAGQSAGQDVGMWVLGPSERLEAMASGAGVNLMVFGVEEVG